MHKLFLGSYKAKISWKKMYSSKLVCAEQAPHQHITEHCKLQTLLAGQGAGALMAKTLSQLCSFQPEQL